MSEQDLLIMIADDNANAIARCLDHIAGSHINFYEMENNVFTEDALTTTVVHPDDMNHEEKSATFEYQYKGIIAEKPADGSDRINHHQHYKVTILVTVTPENCPASEPEFAHYPGGE